MVQRNKSFLKERAVEQSKIYEELTGQKRDYNEFLDDKTNPLTSKIIAYEVSYQLSYMSSKNSMYIEGGDTFVVYTFGQNDMTSEQIMNNTASAIQNSVGKSGNGLNRRTQDMIGDNLKIDLSKPRGMEEVDKEINDRVLDGLRSGKGFYVKQNDSSFTIRNKKGTKFKMKADLSLYFSN